MSAFPVTRVMCYNCCDVARQGEGLFCLKCAELVSDLFPTYVENFNSLCVNKLKRDGSGFKLVQCQTTTTVTRVINVVKTLVENSHGNATELMYRQVLELFTELLTTKNSTSESYYVEVGSFMLYIATYTLKSAMAQTTTAIYMDLFNVWFYWIVNKMIKCNTKFCNTGKLFADALDKYYMHMNSMLTNIEDQYALHKHKIRDHAIMRYLARDEVCKLGNLINKLYYDKSDEAAAQCADMPEFIKTIMSKYIADLQENRAYGALFIQVPSP